MDITYPDYGAYYEAGYAEALGKEVIKTYLCTLRIKFGGKLPNSLLVQYRKQCLRCTGV